ncbi:hypothetical protein [Fundidesulfovibrio agrisoli]|uniref:hypothetical protein n=1 Tax=Fundidesulfovibrio agrisoli TaxID=2922717 RepID=UPI001FACA6EA|nr:hypothetical protein [Fundidesulfovibrio agrisoli]
MSSPAAWIRVAALAVALSAALSVPAQAQSPQRVGGPCTYQEHPGTATIVSVTALPRTSPEAYQPHRILFTFQAQPMIADPLYAPGKVHEMTLTGGAAPGGKFVEKYGIAQGRKIPAAIRLIRGGTCTPVLFRFQGIDLSDRVGMQGPLP